jgi:BON domain
MLEPLFGSGSSWVAAPPSGAGWLQTLAAGSRPMIAPLFFPSQGIPSVASGVSPPAQSMVASSALPPNAPGFASGMVPGLSPVSSLLAAEITGVTPSGLLAAVAIRRGQPQGPTNDHEVEDFIYDAIELLPGTSEVEVRCEGGRATLTGSVQQKRLKRDVGEIAWAIPALNDVQNNVTITSRRRSRIGREVEAGPSPSTRKQP